MQDKKPIVIIVLLAVAIAILGFIAFRPSIQNKAFGAAGNVFGNPQIAQVGLGATATTTAGSLINNSGSTRIIKSAYVVYNNTYTLGTNGSLSDSQPFLVIQIATSVNPYSIRNVSNATNTNYVLNTNLATSTDPVDLFYISSTSPGVIGISNGNARNSTSTRIWNNGEYLNCVTNATTSASGYCGVEFIQE